MAASATLSLSTGVFRQDGLLAGLEWSQRLGLRAVELFPAHARQFQGSEEFRRQVRAKAAECGIRLASIHPKDDLDILPEVCPLAAECRIGMVVVHCKPKRLKEDFAGTVEQASRWAKWCADHGVILAVENASRVELGAFVRLFQAVPELCCTLDIKHAYKPKRFGWTHEDFLRALYDRIRNFHILARHPDDPLGDATPPGPVSLIDIPALAEELARRGYTGLLTIEVPLADLPDEKLPEAYEPFLPPPGPDETTLGRRISRHAVDYYRKQLAAVLEGPAS